MAVNWKGNEILKKVERAQKAGLNETMSDAVIHAKSNHPWRNRTGILEGSIDIHEPAHKAGRGWRGVWGSRDVKYALILELNRRFTYLRPAAAATYGRLARNIKKALKKL